VAEDVAARSTAARSRPSRAERARATAYYLRFTIAYALLTMVAVGGIGALLLILLHPRAKPAAPWSRFVPTGSSLAMERQIATKVSGEYKAAQTGSKIVAVLPGPLQATQFVPTDSNPVSVQVPVSSIAVQPDVSTGKHEEGEFTSLDVGSTVGYEMCGFGNTQQNCGVVATAGPNLGTLLHREALELSLYTLKYVPGANAVLTYLPPPAGSQAVSTAVLLTRKDVKEDLGHPLARTLAPTTVFDDQAVPGATVVDELTRSHIYTYDFQTLPGDGTAILVLTQAIVGQ